MIKKKYIAFILIVLIVLALILLIIRFKVMKSSDITCQAIAENKGKINIAFMSENLAKDKAEDYADYLVNSQPFNEIKENFNFYYAGEASCELVQGGILFCYNSESVKKASMCPDDFVIVLASQGGARSSAYGNFMSLNINQPKSVILHEFGHAFANLADEYVPSIIPRGSKNCQKNCDFEIDEGCFEGCSKDTYYRSADNSVMRTLSNINYGKLNINIIENAIKKY